METLELQDLAALVRIVQAGSFTRAADLGGSGKAQLSRALARLEARLGARLVERTTRALSLTEIGREVYERAVGILGAVDDVERVAQKAHGTPQGTLRLTCGVEFGLMAVGGWIADFLERHPAVVVEAEFSNRIVDLVHEGFDLAIRVGPPPEPQLAVRRLGVVDYLLCAAPGYLDRHGTPGTVAELSQHPRIAFNGGSHRGSWRLIGPEGSQQVDAPPRLLVNNGFAVRDAACAGLGIALLPRLLAEPPLVEGRLRALLPDWAPAPVPVHAVFPSNRYLTAKVRAFVDHAARVFPAAGGLGLRELLAERPGSRPAPTAVRNA